jgi:hypothetical protein
MHDEIEAVAQAFLLARDDEGLWETAPETLRELLREDARVAIAALDEHLAAGPQVSRFAPSTIQVHSRHKGLLS